MTSLFIFRARRLTFLSSQAFGTTNRRAETETRGILGVIRIRCPAQLEHYRSFSYTPTGKPNQITMSAKPPFTQASNAGKHIKRTNQLRLFVAISYLEPTRWGYRAPYRNHTSQCSHRQPISC
jgi:hypothetical protein